MTHVENKRIRKKCNFPILNFPLNCPNYTRKAHSFILLISRFQPNVSDRDAANHAKKMIQNNLLNKRTVIYDKIQYYQNEIAHWNSFLKSLVFALHISDYLVELVDSLDWKSFQLACLQDHLFSALQISWWSDLKCPISPVTFEIKPWLSQISINQRF